MKMSNVDREEIRKFGMIAQQWWDKKGQCKPLHDINPLRMSYIRSRAEISGAKVLDAGCGGGILSEALAAAGAEVTGIDMGEEALAAARMHLQESGYAVTYRQTTVEDLAAEKPGNYDLITCMEMLEHVPDPRSVIRSCKTLLKPGGNIIFATLNRNFKSFLFAIIGAEYILRLLPAGTHRHDKFIRPPELAEWAEDAGLFLADTAGLQYNPFSRRYFLSRNTDVNYFMHFRYPA
ncbi:MAG: bifunctional 2-polyprenyl-6-hydroxyphenol methylase/3-demethylubiquinol 3-O-methyltransferase UbiG [Desulfococcaceae bacterium]|jgi:2-polyprenyl-6-hydroxyphenyl methylase/3-demethylubiquinone-9 3-methyltransferase|nr:bifunctional 2-polyprenyl-6-hydroxyphenol methylase/3-demethylubiquinol 3-O-methyltransferase UbiG [Desulfococcaceae bacterium]